MKRSSRVLASTATKTLTSSSEGRPDIINSESDSPRASITIVQNNSLEGSEPARQRLCTQPNPWRNFLLNNSEGTILKVNNFNEVNQLQLLLSNTKFDAIIQGLDFENLQVDSSTNVAIQTLLNTLDQDSNFSLNLISFKIGNIQDHITFTLPDSFTNLITLHIGNLGNDTTWVLKYIPTTLKLPNLLNNLTTLKIGNIHDNVVLSIPNTLDNIATITIGDFDADAKLDLSFALPSLQILIVGNLPYYSHFRFPSSCDNLQILTLGNIGTGIKLPTLLNNLTSLTIGAIEAHAALASKVLEDYEEPIIVLEKLDNLTTLTFGNISYGAHISLPSLLNNLTTLTFGNIGIGVTLNPPTSVENLQTVTAGAINDDSICIQLDSFGDDTNVQIDYTRSSESCVIQ